MCVCVCDTKRQEKNTVNTFWFSLFKSWLHKDVGFPFSEGKPSKLSLLNYNTLKSFFTDL